MNMRDKFFLVCQIRYSERLSWEVQKRQNLFFLLNQYWEDLRSGVEADDKISFHLRHTKRLNIIFVLIFIFQQSFFTISKWKKKQNSLKYTYKYRFQCRRMHFMFKCFYELIFDGFM